MPLYFVFGSKTRNVMISRRKRYLPIVDVIFLFGELFFQEKYTNVNENVPYLLKQQVSSLAKLSNNRDPPSF